MRKKEKKKTTNFLEEADYQLEIENTLFLKNQYANTLYWTIFEKKIKNSP